MTWRGCDAPAWINACSLILLFGFIVAAAAIIEWIKKEFRRQDLDRRTQDGIDRASRRIASQAAGRDWPE
jgi:hypothetical protein